jgi:hypothetical protein
MTRVRSVTGSARAPGPARGEARVIVVFEDRAATGGFRWLRSGFRHCFCLVRRPVGWIVCDPLKSKTCLEVVDPYDERELLLHYRRRNAIVLVGRCIEPDRGRDFFRPLTCVEIVKRVVGLRAPRVWTPYQLYRALRHSGFAADL